MRVNRTTAEPKPDEATIEFDLVQMVIYCRLLCNRCAINHNQCRQLTAEMLDALLINMTTHTRCFDASLLRCFDGYVQVSAASTQISWKFIITIVALMR